MEVKTFTLAEVASRNGKSGAPVWLVYRDGVYDVTQYAQEHPGGIDAILEEAGTDATKAFNEIHSSDAKKIIVKYKIGEIVEEEKKYDASGKKKKRVISVPPEQTNRGLCSIITCGLMG